MKYGTLVFALGILFSIQTSGAGFENPKTDNDYQIGSEWGKKPVSQDDLDNGTAVFRRAALATARAGAATSFYLGEFAGQHVMATNHHVFPSEHSCLVARISFTLLGIDTKCTHLIGSWPEIDLALFTVDVPADQEEALAEVGANFAFHNELYAGEPLLTIGYGVTKNISRKLMANQDSDCKVFSNKGEFKLMGDPDAFNPADYKAWSFANGCDVSHGDSGSAMVDRNTGEVVGLLWTGKVPKDGLVQNSDALDKVLRNHGSLIWTDLTYSVPAAKIGEMLERIAEDASTAPADRETLRAILK